MHLKLSLGSEHLLANHIGIGTCMCNSRWARDFLLAIDLGSGHSLASHILFGIFTNWDWNMHLQLTLESEHSQLTLESEYSLATYIGAERQRETQRDIGSHEQRRLHKSPTRPLRQNPTKQYNACFIFQWSNTEAWSRARSSHESTALGHRPGAHHIGRQSSIKRLEYHSL